jgi:N-acyl-D-amino-acid deacylase
LEGANINWQSFAEYLSELGKMQFGCNIASLVGYSTLRRGVVGDEIRSLQKDELEVLKKALQESLKAGAFGFSSGLSYAHEIIISELELFELAKIVKENGGLFSIHLRSEGAEVVEAVSEALDIAKAGDLNLKISHLKVRNEQNWNKINDVIAEIDTAFHQGVNVHFDVYPYESIWQVLYSYLPKWAIEGGRAVMLKHFADPVLKNKILSYLNNSGVKFSNLMIASTTNRLNFTGKTIGQIAKNMEISSEQALLHILENGGSEILVFEENLNPESVENLLFHPLSFISTDGAGFPEKNQNKLVHPRCFGTTAKFLRTAIDKKVISLEQAVNKLTLGPASKIGLKNRGQIAIGSFADLVIFNPQELAGKSTYQNPNQFSSGFDYVFVNGQAVVDNGQLTAKKPGYVLKNNQA